jgi:NADH-quinone oxidoreductase subunit M
VAILVTGAFQLVAGGAMVRLCSGGTVHGPWTALIGTGAALYAALAILAGTPDLRRVVGYVSTAQMGMFLLSLSTQTAAGGAGAVLLLTAHSISIAMLLFVAGVIRDRTGHCDIQKLGGIAEHMPAFGAWAALAFLTAMGVPGLAVFPGLFLSLTGAFEAARQRPETGPTLWPGMLAIVAVMLLAGGLLWTYQRVFLGIARPEHSNVAALSFTEKMVLGFLAIISLVVGIAPVLISEATKIWIGSWAHR